MVVIFACLHHSSTHFFHRWKLSIRSNHTKFGEKVKNYRLFQSILFDMYFHSHTKKERPSAQKQLIYFTEYTPDKLKAYISILWFGFYSICVRATCNDHCAGLSQTSCMCCGDFVFYMRKAFYAQTSPSQERTHGSIARVDSVSGFSSQPEHTWTRHKWIEEKCLWESAVAAATATDIAA